MLKGKESVGVYLVETRHVLRLSPVQCRRVTRTTLCEVIIIYILLSPNHSAMKKIINLKVLRNNILIKIIIFL